MSIIFFKFFISEHFRNRRRNVDPINGRILKRILRKTKARKIAPTNGSASRIRQSKRTKETARGKPRTRPTLKPDLPETKHI